MKHTRNRAGVTLVELIVTFALIAMFIAAAAGLVPAMLKLYHRIQVEDQEQSVADALIQSIRAELQSANGRTGEEGGASYIKLRDDDGNSVAFDENGMEGVTAEFICTAHVEDEMDILLFAEQIDTKGLTASASMASATQAVLYQKNSGAPDEVEHNYKDMGTDELVRGYVVQRYYTADSSTLYQDVFSGKPRFYNAQMMYATGAYMNHTASLKFIIPKEAIETVGTDHYVRYVRLEVTLTHTSGRTYTASSVIKLTNEPYYTSDNTMASD